MKKQRYSYCLSIIAAASLSGCAVYVPTVPSTPLVSKKGEVEVTAGLRNLSFSNLQTSVAWSPATHVVVTGEAALQTSKVSETRNNVTTDFHNVHRQAGLGLGTYRLLGKNQSIYLGAVGGVGLATASVYDPNTDAELFAFFGGGAGSTVHYAANYLRYYGQLYVAHLGPLVNYGASARGTVVNYTHLLRDGESIEAPTRFFVEPTMFMRVGKGPIQGQGTIGFSVPVRSGRQSPDYRNLSPITTLVSIGVVVRPHFFRHQE